MNFVENKRRLILSLKSSGYLNTKEVIDAMEKVPRELFVPESQKRSAYKDSPLFIGYGQTISAPHMVALMAEALELRSDDKVLEIGTGRGYNACVIAQIVDRVYTIERCEELAEIAMNNIKKLGLHEKIKVSVSDGSLGLEEFAPYDKILLTCGTGRLPPPLAEQLKEGGKAIAPIGKRYIQELMLYEKKGGSLKKRRLGPVVFVPLIGEYGFEES